MFDGRPESRQRRGMWKVLFNRPAGKVLGVASGGVALMAGVSPGDAKSNLSQWLEELGLPPFEDILTPAVDDWVLLAAVVFAIALLAPIRLWRHIFNKASAITSDTDETERWEKHERRRARIQAEEWKKVEGEEKAKSIIRMNQPGGIEYEAWLQKIAGRGDQAAEAIEAAPDFVAAKRVFDDWRYSEHPRARGQVVAAMIARLRAEGPTPETETFLLAELEHDSTVDSVSVSYGKNDPDYEGDDHRYEWMVIGFEDMWTRNSGETDNETDA